MGVPGPPRDPQEKGDLGGRTPSQNIQLQIDAAPWPIERKRFRLIPNHFGYLLSTLHSRSVLLALGILFSERKKLRFSLVMHVRSG